MTPQQFLDLEPQFSGGRKAKFYDLPRVIGEWLAPYGGFQGKRVLDLGCGFGETAAGIALAYEPEMVVGSDIKPHVGLTPAHLAELGLSEVPANLRYESIRPGQICSEPAIDIALSWSAFEHIERGILDGVIRDLRDSLTDGGLLFVQISPLYFSPEGSHLWEIGYGAWEHLLKQTSEVRAEIERAPIVESQRKHLWSLFETLNRLTAPDLITRLEDGGFEVLRKQLDQVEAEPPAVLRHAYADEALRTHQVVLLLRKV